MKIQQKVLRSLFVAITAFALAACGGSGGGGGSDPPAPPARNSSPGGIWKGTASSGQALVGIVTETGEFTFIQDDGVQYFCNMIVNQNAVSAGFTGITPFGSKFANGSTSGSGSLSATIAERASLQGNINFAAASAGGPGAQKTNPAAAGPAPCGSTPAGVAAGKVTSAQGPSSAKLFNTVPLASANPTLVGGTFSLTYDALYDRDSSLATIAGNFKGPDGTIVSVDANGAIFSQDAATGCVINGRVSLINTSYNAYRVEYNFASCTGNFTALNGTAFAGLGTLDNTAVPEQAIIAVTHQKANAAYGLVYVLDRT